VGRLWTLAVAAAAAALAIVGAGEAKGPAGARICGAVGCVRLALPEAALLERARDGESWSPPLEPQAPAPARFYRVTIRSHGGREWSYLWVPMRRSIRIDDPRDATPSFWRLVTRSFATMLDRYTAPVRPAAAPARWRR
jgi:hypothetical protein